MKVSVTNTNYLAVGLGAILYAILISLIVLVGGIVGIAFIVMMLIIGVVFVILSPFQLIWYVIKGLKSDSH